ncbi:hypothetical protein SAMN05443668_1111, partial [Cryptosporangium aurantiacum]
GTINPPNDGPRVKHLALTFEHTVEFSNNTRASNPPARTSLRLAVFRFQAYPNRFAEPNSLRFPIERRKCNSGLLYRSCRRRFPLAVLRFPAYRVEFAAPNSHSSFRPGPYTVTNRAVEALFARASQRIRSIPRRQIRPPRPAQHYRPVRTGQIGCFPAGRPLRRLRDRLVSVSPAGSMKSTRLADDPQTARTWRWPHLSGHSRWRLCRRWPRRPAALVAPRAPAPAPSDKGRPPPQRTSNNQSPQTTASPGHHRPTGVTAPLLDLGLPRPRAGPAHGGVGSTRNGTTVDPALGGPAVGTERVGVRSSRGGLRRVWGGTTLTLRRRIRGTGL